jgi:hypothetical protein
MQAEINAELPQAAWGGAAKSDLRAEEQAPVVIVTSLLNTLAVRYDQRRMAAVAIDDQIAVLQQRRDEITGPLDTEISDLEQQIKAHVLKIGVTIKAGDYAAVYSKARETVDPQQFKGLLLAHPEYGSMLTVGQPTVSIRPVRRRDNA